MLQQRSHAPTSVGPQPVGCICWPPLMYCGAKCKHRIIDPVHQDRLFGVCILRAVTVGPTSRRTGLYERKGEPTSVFTTSTPRNIRSHQSLGIKMQYLSHHGSIFTKSNSSVLSFCADCTRSTNMVWLVVNFEVPRVSAFSEEQSKWGND